MSTRIDALYYELGIRDAQFAKAIPQNAERLRALERAGVAAVLPIGALEASLTRASGAATGASGGIDRVSASINQLQRLLQALGLAIGVKQLVDWADGWSVVSAKLGLVTKSSERLAMVQRDLFGIAQDTQTAYEATADAYLKITKSADTLGLSYRQVLQLTRTLNEAFAVNGSATEEQADVMKKLGLVFSGVAANGRELQMILTESPRLAKTIADGMGTTVAQLQQLAQDGKITARSVADALLSQSDAVNREFRQMPLTVGLAMTMVTNAIKRFVGEADQSTAASRTLAGALRSVAEHFALVANAALAIGGVALARTLAPVGERILAFVAAQKAAIAAHHDEEAAAIRATTAAKAQALAAVELARAKQAETAATLANLRATQAAIVVARQEAVAKLQAAQATLGRASAQVPIGSLAPLGGAAVERELARRAQLTQNVSTATRELATLGAQQARVEAQLAAATAANAAAQRATALATGTATRAALAHTATLGGMTVVARVTAGAMALLRGAMAFMGGPIGLAITAVAGAFAIMSHNASAAREETEKFKNSLRGMSPREYQAMITDLEDRILKARQELANDKVSLKRARELQREIPQLQERLRLTKEVARAEAAANPPSWSGPQRDQKAVEDLQKRLRELRFDASAPDALAKVRHEMQLLMEEARKAGMTTGELRAFAQALNEVYQARKFEVGRSLAEQLHDELVKLTPTLVDDLDDEIEKLRKRRADLAAAGGRPDQLAEADRLLALKAALRDVQQQAEDLDLVLAGVARRENEARAEDLATLSRRQDLLQIELDGTEDAAVRARIEEQIRKIEEQRAKLVERRTGANKQDTDEAKRQREELSRRVQDQARQIKDAASGALELARAFGAVTDETERALRNIIDISAGIGPLVDALKSGKAGGIIGAALPVLGGLAGLLSSAFGESPAEKQRKEVQRQNTEAIKQLTLKIGDLATATTPGGHVAAAQRVFGAAGVQEALGANDFTWNTSTKMRNRFNATIYGEFEKLGLSLRDVQDLAKSLGITLDGSRGSWLALRDALKEADLAAFTDTFGGALERLHDSFEVYDITDPVERLRRSLATLSNAKTGIPAIARAFQGLDVGNTEDRAKAIERLQRLFEDLAAGRVSAADLGGASLTETRAQLLELLRMLREEDAAAGASGTGGFHVDRSITEVTGSYLRGLLTTANVWHQQTAENTAIIARALAGTSAAIPSVSPPALPPTATDVGGAGGIVINLTVPITLATGMTPADGEAIGRAAGQAAGDELDRILGERQRGRARAEGMVLLS